MAGSRFRPTTAPARPSVFMARRRDDGVCVGRLRFCSTSSTQRRWSGIHAGEAVRGQGIRPRRPCLAGTFAFDVLGLRGSSPSPGRRLGRRGT